MDFYVGTLGELVIVEAFVFWIWLKVLLDAVANKEGTVAHKKLLLTSLGLVLNAVSIVGIMSFRIYLLVSGEWNFVWGVVSFYILQAIGNFLFIVSACVGGSTRLLKAFFAVTAAWTVFTFSAYHFW